MLEIGPGYGVTTRWLAERTDHLTAIEVDAALAADLRTQFAGRVDVRHGGGAALPFAEAARVLRPGGVFAGSDSRLSLLFRILRIRDTMVVVDPDTLPDCFRLAGLTDPQIELSNRSLRFRATRPLLAHDRRN